MYPNLKAEMARLGMTQQDLATSIGITYQALNAKINRRKSFTLDEAKKIQLVLKTKITLDNLFKAEE